MSTGTTGHIDWQAVHRRLAALGQAIRGECADDAGQAVLQARAAELARAAREEPAGERVTVLEFQVAGERYAVETSCLKETFPLTEFTPLFCTPPFVLGITNLRGKIVSIVELTRFFGLPAVGLSNLNRVVVVGDGAMEFGILADSVCGIREIPAADLQAPPATVRGIAAEFIAGVTTERLALLDMKKILADPRLVVQEEVE